MYVCTQTIKKNKNVHTCTSEKVNYGDGEGVEGDNVHVHVTGAIQTQNLLYLVNETFAGRLMRLRPLTDLLHHSIVILLECSILLVLTTQLVLRVRQF